MIDLPTKKIFVSGHKGMVGSAIVSRLKQDGSAVIITSSRSEVDLRDQRATLSFMEKHKPDVVLVAAAKVGGIRANDTYPADFLYDNIMIAANLIDAAHRINVAKLLFLGSSCIYPRLSLQPIKEDYLLTGPLEPTNEWYAIAKIAGIKLCQAYRKQYGNDFISCQPTNLYGPNDYFNLYNSHVLPALLRKAHEAKVSNATSFEVWGTGTPRREFLHVDDLADACVFLLKNYSDPQPINVGWGKDVTIAELAQLVKEIVGFEGEIIYNPEIPDGTPQKLLDTQRLKELGWQPSIDLPQGIKEYYSWFLENKQQIRN